MPTPLVAGLFLFVSVGLPELLERISYKSHAFFILILLTLFWELEVN